MRVTHYAAHTHKNDNNKPKCRNQIHLPAEETNT